MESAVIGHAHLQNDVGAPRPLQRPLAVGERRVLAGVAGALDDVAARLEVELAATRAVELVGPVAAVVLVSNAAELFRMAFQKIREHPPTWILEQAEAAGTRRQTG